MNGIIRRASVGDSEAILQIYAYFVEHTPASFETVTPSHIEFSNRVASIIKSYPYLVYVENSKIVGFAYASAHKERAAYRYDADVSIYISKGAQGKGVGTALYTALFKALADIEIYNTYAGITLPNDKSVALHRKFGFKDIGIHHNTGFKLGKWHDVLWLEKQLKDYSITPR